MQEVPEPGMAGGWAMSKRPCLGDVSGAVNHCFLRPDDGFPDTRELFPRQLELLQALGVRRDPTLDSTIGTNFIPPAGTCQGGHFTGVLPFRPVAGCGILKESHQDDHHQKTFE